MTVHSRDAVTTLAFADHTFADTLVRFDNTLDASFTEHGARSVMSTRIKGLYENLTFGASSGLSLDLLGLIPGSGDYTARFGGEAATSSQLEGQFSIGYEVPAVSGDNPGNASFAGVFEQLVRGKYRHALWFAGGGEGLVDSPGVFRSTVILPGEWTFDITADHYIATFSKDPSFDILTNFVYDPISDTTTLVLENDNATSSAAPHIAFLLIGSPVPAPGSLAVLALGSLATRRRR